MMKSLQSSDAPVSGGGSPHLATSIVSRFWRIFPPAETLGPGDSLSLSSDLQMIRRLVVTFDLVWRSPNIRHIPAWPLPSLRRPCFIVPSPPYTSWLDPDCMDSE
ncbi:hypothetical protein GDO81_024449 [Engystomops pustulosus]|uniref:Uncharacterized protein n=1 Tax=Engystomops pustulosus TaxID=76066 RepID=A0AAV6YJW3_ENGPU|nr:hypothetical protein GDO81_024449 [Engystomops pustulosus]